MSDAPEQRGGNTQSSANPQRIRIFLASPGDVPLERKLARETVDQISNERRFRGRLKIEVIAWDQPGAAVAMEAGLTPQDAIAQGLPKPEDCDLAVVVLWSRIGTPLPPDFDQKPDGTAYLSGTEWEYHNALNGFRDNGKPAVWIYRRKGAPQFSADDEHRQIKLDQWDKVEQFFAAFSNPDGSLTGGINRYDSPDDFRRQFENHLRDRLDKLLEELPAPTSPADNKTVTAPAWTESPYPGLAAFTPEQAPIYFGRGAIVDQLLSLLAQPRARFVAVVGASGSGKSSLVMAGLLPRLRAGIVGNAPWADLRIKPGERGGDPFLALAYRLKQALSINNATEQEIARRMFSEPARAPEHFASLLAKHSPHTELLLLVDQFEELFTQAPNDKAHAFIDLLDRLTRIPRLRVVITLRADFYAQAADNAVLAKLLRHDGGTFPLDPPRAAALLEMIERPAALAGVELESGLAQRLLDEAGSEPGALALIAYTLHHLYDTAGDSGGLPGHVLSTAAYDAFGGVRGAVEQRATAALRGLPIDTEQVLPRLFTHLVEVNEQEIATRRRAAQHLLDDDAQRLAAALTDARLLTSGEGENGEPSWEVAHEAVLNGWSTLSDWIGTHAESLRARRDLERVAGEWHTAGRHSGALRGGRLLQRYQGAATPRSATADDYLRACQRRRTAHRFGYAILVLLSISMIGLLFHLNKSAYGPTFAAKALFVHWGLWPLDPPRMVDIDAGRFKRGDANGAIDEHPIREVEIAAFEIGRYEVTFDEYDLFAAATGRAKPSEQWGPDFRGRHPVINVSWEDARAYAAWLSERTNSNYRLPTEAEWEYAARAGTVTTRYWPDATEGEPDPACAHANVFDQRNERRLTQTYAISWAPFGCADDYPFTAPVGQFQPNRWQLHDMLGNVWEWVQDCYAESYAEAPIDGSAHETVGECERRVLRGGSWYFVPRFVRSSHRGWDAPIGRSHFVGFRLASTL